jgi:hypothetical protein
MRAENDRLAVELHRLLAHEWPPPEPLDTTTRTN